MTVEIFADANGGEVLVMAISDGAGSASKAEIGSWLACTTILEAAKVFLADGGNVGEFTPNAARSWVGMIQDAIQQRSEVDCRPVRDYACTLLTAVLGSDAGFIMQVGDGATVVSDGDGWAWVHWPQHGEYSNTTFFVTGDDAQLRMEFELCSRIDEIAMFSDGLENLVLHQSSRTVFGPFFDRMMPAVRSSETEGVDKHLSEALTNYLGSPEICARTDDDKTLVLATRRASVAISEATPERPCTQTIASASDT